MEGAKPCHKWPIIFSFFFLRTTLLFSLANILQKLHINKWKIEIYLHLAAFSGSSEYLTIMKALLHQLKNKLFMTQSPRLPQQQLFYKHFTRTKMQSTWIRRLADLECTFNTLFFFLAIRINNLSKSIKKGFKKTHQFQGNSY